MTEALKLMLIVVVLEGFSSSLGGILGSFVKVKSNNLVSSLFEMAAGIMTAIVCFQMLPESFVLANFWINILGIIIGVSLICLLDVYIDRNKKVSKGYKMSTMSLIIIIAMMAHNIVEGIAIGASAGYSLTLGIAILISMFLHNIPEGMIVGISMKLDGKSFLDIVKYSAIVGMPTGIGAFIGSIVGNISDTMVAYSLSFSAGAMLYVVACDLIPNSQKISKNRYISLMYIIGIIIGLIGMQL